MRFRRATELAHDLVRERVQPGDMVIDATAGNGHDTLFLAGLVGEEGRVVGYDIQPEAIEATRRGLEQAGVEDRAELRLESHELIGNEQGEIRVAMFNLGYLPGGDKGIVTQPETTISAIQGCLKRLERGGIVTVVVYSGHEGGTEEAQALSGYLEQLDQESFSVIRYGFTNQTNHPPFLIAVEKR